MKRILYSGLVLWLSGTGCRAEIAAWPSEMREHAKSGEDAGASAPTPDGGTLIAQSSESDSGNRARDGSSSYGVCERVRVPTALITPQILIVLDRSGSMAPNLNDTGTDRWAGSVQALKVVTSEFNDRVDFGLMAFPDVERPDDPDNRSTALADSALCAPGAVKVEIGSERAADIATALDAISPAGLTPTGVTLQAALKVLSGTASANQQVISPKYVLLITDGDPNCSSASEVIVPVDPLAREESVTAIEDLTDTGVQTFVVGFETVGTAFAYLLDQMAAAGGTGQREHTSVGSGADLSSTVEGITRRAVSCSYQLQEKVENASYLLVSVDGKARTYEDVSDGWSLGADRRTVVLTGAACDAHQSGADLVVEVACEIVQVI